MQCPGWTRNRALAKENVKSYVSEKPMRYCPQIQRLIAGYRPKNVNLAPQSIVRSIWLLILSLARRTRECMMAKKFEKWREKEKRGWRGRDEKKDRKKVYAHTNTRWPNLSPQESKRRRLSTILGGRSWSRGENALYSCQLITPTRHGAGNVHIAILGPPHETSRRPRL